MVPAMIGERSITARSPAEFATPNAEV